MGKGCSLTAVIFVSREHGGPEGMDPDGVIEVRNRCGIWNVGKVGWFIPFIPLFFLTFRATGMRLLITLMI